MDVLQVDIRSAGYHEEKQIIENIQFQVQAGELVGLIGPNGAGKSTTMKAMLGLLKRMDGTVRMSGPSGSYTYVPERPIFYEQMTLWEHLELAASAYGMTTEKFREKADELLNRFRLEDAKHDLPISFSKGMQQKMMLILGFLIQPDVYIIDEPFIGLDPRATKDFLDMIELEKKRGAGVLMTTHVLDTAEKICDRFILINRGRIVAKGTLTEIQQQCGTPESSLFDCFNAIS